MAISLLNELRIDRPADTQGQDRLDQLADELEKKAPFDEDSHNLRQFKGLIRKAEARASCQVLGLDIAKVLFLDLPFYEKGRYRQFNSTGEDVSKIRQLCQGIKLHQIYVTGSGAEPGSVSGFSFRMVISALGECVSEAWMKACQIWMYASSEQPWSPHEINMAVPLSPAELTVKLDCLYHHRSQRSQTPFLGSQTGESWQQAENNNRATAQHYDRLGLPEYEAIESFRRQKESESRG
jgi:glucosamine-6-phosphate deaminase